jgi:hypothetical protein
MFLASTVKNIFHKIADPVNSVMPNLTQEAVNLKVTVVFLSKQGCP